MSTIYSRHRHLNIDIYFSDLHIIKTINIHMSLYMIVNEVEMSGAA